MTSDLVSDEQLAEIERDWEHVIATGGAVKLAECDICAAAFGAFSVLLRALRDARGENAVQDRRISELCDRLREARAEITSWRDGYEQAAKERDDARAENQQLRDHVAALQNQDERNLAEIVALGDRIEAVERACAEAEALHRKVWDEMEDYASIGHAKGPFPGHSQVSVDAVRAALAAPTGQEQGDA